MKGPIPLPIYSVARYSNISEGIVFAAATRIPYSQVYCARMNPALAFMINVIGEEASRVSHTANKYLHTLPVNAS